MGRFRVEMISATFVAKWRAFKTVGMAFADIEMLRLASAIKVSNPDGSSSDFGLVPGHRGCTASLLA
jgi:hypothetical protein